MTTIADVIKRDLGTRVEGVVKVFDEAALASEVREFVVTDHVERELRSILDAFTHASQALRRGGATRDVMGVWLSGFFGSGKSHLAKVLGHLLQNDELDGGGTRCIDEFVEHLSDDPTGQEVKRKLGEVKLGTRVRTVAFEIRSRQNLTNPGSVGEIILSEFHRQTGLSENFIVARLERLLAARGKHGDLAAAYESAFGQPWHDGRDDLLTVRRRLEQVLPEVDPQEFPDNSTAKQALADLFAHARLTPAEIAEELVDWVEDQPADDGRVNHLVFVIDEVGTFISDSEDKIGELQSLAEHLGSKGKGRVWLIVTSQQDLERVVDRTNFQPALVGRLNARFELKPHLVTDGIERIVAERILKKKPAEEGALRELFLANEGQLAQLADLRSTRVLAALDERSFTECYPLLPPQVKLAQDVFEALSGFRISGGVRSMISVAMDVLKAVAAEDLGALVSFDQIYDAIESDLFSPEYLGQAGARAVAGATQAVPDTPVDAARVLKVLWLLGQVNWVPRVPETIAKLLSRHVGTDLPTLRGEVEETLQSLQRAGYVALDAASGEWKYLNEQERTIEQAIQQYVRPAGPKSIGLASLRRTAQQLCRDQVITKRRLSNFAVLHGHSRIPFAHAVYLDGEAIETGSELEVKFVGPLAPGRKEELEQIRAENQAGGPSGRTVWLAARPDDRLVARLRRHEALLRITSEKRFVEDTAKATQDALSERRKERDDLAGALMRDLERSFLHGALFHGGQEVDLDGAGNLAELVEKALSAVIPNVFPSFSPADQSIDFTRAVKALLNPATTSLDAVAPDLGLFDTQGSLQRESTIVAPLLEALEHLADEGVDASGATLLDAGERRGFRGFTRRPFGWSDEIVRLVLAACLRAGAVFIERQTATGPKPAYDFQGAEDDFVKITAFKRLTVRLAQTTLTVAQIRDASRALVGLGVTGVAESGNALAGAILELGDKLRAGVAEAGRLADQGLPLPDELLRGDLPVSASLNAGDPTSIVTEFLAAAGAWSDLDGSLGNLRTFSDAGRDREFARYERLAAEARLHPVAGSHPLARRAAQALADMEAIRAARDVVGRWQDYRRAAQELFDAYREVYSAAYDAVRSDVADAVAELRNGEAYAAAPPDGRDAVLERTFGSSGAMHHPAVATDSPQALFDAASRRSLSSLDQARMALPGYRSQALAELRSLSAPAQPGERIHKWSASHALAGRRLVTEPEVDAALAGAADELKEKIREGFVVEVR